MSDEDTVLNVKTAGTMATLLVIIIGLSLIAPMFFIPQQPEQLEKKQSIVLCFSVIENSNAKPWCLQLSQILKTNNVSATIFFTGQIAEQNPEIISYFGTNVDIGSQTYSYKNLTSITDYSMQLEEVKKGKEAVDKAGNIDSKIFRAPNQDTDQNIYSLLSRNKILADFSYDDQYNVYVNSHFLKFDAQTLNGSASSTLSFEKNTESPIIIYFDNRCPTEAIANFIANMRAQSFVFLNATDLTGQNLTERRG